MRTGIEITNAYQPVSWFRPDADLAFSRGRFVGFDTAQQELFDSLTGFPQAQIGNAPGNFVPEAPWMVASAGITLGERTGWFSTLRWRYISSRPLTEDGVFQSPPINTINDAVRTAVGPRSAVRTSTRMIRDGKCEYRRVPLQISDLSDLG